MLKSKFLLYVFSADAQTLKLGAANAPTHHWDAYRIELVQGRGLEPLTSRALGQHDALPVEATLEIGAEGWLFSTRLPSHTRGTLIY